VLLEMTLEQGPGQGQGLSYSPAN